MAFGFSILAMLLTSPSELDTNLLQLVLNAGPGVGVHNDTKDGIDSHMQVNVIL
jgi:hypothetical protein